MLNLALEMNAAIEFCTEHPSEIHLAQRSPYESEPHMLLSALETVTGILGLSVVEKARV